jgi:enamine deaminase RidA (YjgF/YER057c/UK114 family)
MSSFTGDALRALETLGLRLPDDLPAPAGNYASFRLHNGLGFLSAQVPGYGPDNYLGRVGIDLTVDQGVRAAERAALNALARIHEALDGFDRLVGLLHCAGHVSSGPAFFDQPTVLDGASDLFANVLGERGQHTRTAYPAPRLPKNVSIELEITFAYSSYTV